jgi:hypothetical protein
VKDNRMAVPAWLTVISWVFIGIGLASAAVIAADIYLLGCREHVKIMEAVWLLTALYAGPLALAGYVRWAADVGPVDAGPRPRHARQAVLGRDGGQCHPLRRGLCAGRPDR